MIIVPLYARSVTGCIYNIASRATQSNSVYVSILKIPIVLADGVSKMASPEFFARAALVSAGKNIIFHYNLDTNRYSAH